MSLWSCYLFGASLVFGMGMTILAERMQAWWGPASVLALVLAASAFLICSVPEYRRGRLAIGAGEE
jgi:hypothetical protein